MNAYSEQQNFGHRLFTKKTSLNSSDETGHKSRKYQTFKWLLLSPILFHYIMVRRNRGKHVKGLNKKLLECQKFRCTIKKFSM